MRNVYPSYKKFFHEVECRTSLAFYEQYPFPSHLQAVTEEELAEFLRFHSHNTCSIKRAVEIISLVEKDVIKEREYQYARNGAIQSIVRNIRFNNEEMKRIEKIEAEMLKELSGECRKRKELSKQKSGKSGIISCIVFLGDSAGLY